MKDDKVVPETVEDDTTKIFEAKDVTCKSSHTFKHISARHVVCDCGAGYELSEGMSVEEGHIYKESILII